MNSREISRNPWETVSHLNTVALPCPAPPALPFALPERFVRPSGRKPATLGTMVSPDPLVQRAQQGDRAAMEELFRRHREDVSRIVFRFLGPSPDLEDVVQEAFIQMFRSIERFEGHSKFSTWMYRLVSNVAKMHLRAQGSRPKLASGEAQDAHTALQMDEDQLPPDSGTEQRARLRALYRHVNALSEKKREALVLHDFEGLSAGDIAEVTETPVMTVRTRLFYARKEIYAALAADPLFADASSQEWLAQAGGKRR